MPRGEAKIRQYRARVRQNAKRVAGVGLALFMAVACVAKPTSEDRRRADALRADPLFARDTFGIAEQRVSVFVGHGGGPSNAWSEISRDSMLTGAPEDAIRDAVDDALATGWIIQTISCFPASAGRSSGYLLRGVKQFDGFVGSLASRRTSPTFQDSRCEHRHRPRNSAVRPP
ncbi:MAG: hypothetical protein QOI95_2830 [Acidimicrobiaceae bacterium]|jgi:hypothetical protein